VGTTGLSIPGRGEQLTRYLAARLPHATLRVGSDVEVAWWAGLVGQPGIVVVAGTGSIALARSADGRQARAGGWGPLLGDQGGFWVGRQALSALLRTLEGRQPPSRLTQAVAAALHLDPPRTTVSAVLGWATAGGQHETVARVAALASVVAAAAAADDPAAVNLLADAAQHLADLAIAAADQVWSTDWPRPLDVVTLGGVGSAPSVRQRFAALVRARGRDLHLVPAALPPVGGALLLAMDAPSRTPSRALIDNLAAGLA